MGSKRLIVLQSYIDFLKEFDKKLDVYFSSHASFLCCKKGCSACCEKGDYPVSELELKYLMQGYASLAFEMKITVQENFKNIEKGGACPFLVNSECSVYAYRPIICRVHGLAYLCKDNVVKLPYCVHSGMNYNDVYINDNFLAEPISEQLDTVCVLKDFKFGEVRNLYDWIANS